MEFHIITGRDLIKIPKINHPITPKQKIEYIGKDIATAGSGLMLQTKNTCGTKEIVAKSPPHQKPILSAHFCLLTLISTVFLQYKKLISTLPERNYWVNVFKNLIF